MRSRAPRALTDLSGPRETATPRREKEREREREREYRFGVLILFIEIRQLADDAECQR